MICHQQTKSCIKLGCESVCGITSTITLNSVKQSILHLYFILDPMNFHEVTTSLRQLASKEVQFERSRSIIDRLQIPQQEIVTPLASLGLYAAPARDDGEADRYWQWARIYKKGQTERGIILFKLNKSLLESSKSVGIHRQKVCIP